jgi:chaperonin GroEL (HSP60 family)
MDKMIVYDKVTTISNDGATFVKLLQIVHPAAKSLAYVA